MNYVGTHTTDGGKVYMFNKFPSGSELRCTKCGANTTDATLARADVEIVVGETATPEKLADMFKEPRFAAQAPVDEAL